MRPRSLALAALALLLAMPLAAFDRGDVFLVHNTASPFSATPSFFPWYLPNGTAYATGIGVPLLYKDIPFLGRGHFIAPAPDRILFHDGHTVSWWDGVYRIFSEPGKGYTDLFTDDADLGDFAVMASGHYLVAERSTDASRAPEVIEFDLGGRVTSYALPGVPAPLPGRTIGAQFIELLSDQCTLLYTVGDDDPFQNDRVRRYDLCKRQAESDFATLTPGQYAGAIRQLPNGDVLVANGNAVLQFDAHGGLLRSYPLAGVTHVALSPDAALFWATAVDNATADLRHYDWRVPNMAGISVSLGNPGMQSIDTPVSVDDLVVVGEGRASAPKKGRSRAVR